jgi:hypothetical protein
MGDDPDLTARKPPDPDRPEQGKVIMRACDLSPTCMHPVKAAALDGPAPREEPNA